MMDVMSMIKEIGAIYKSGNYEKCMKELTAFWESLPEPKEDIPNSYLLIEYGARISLLLKNYEEAWKWALLGMKYVDTRNLMGESEFLIGKVAFEKNDLKSAKKYFLIAKKKSKGKAFEGQEKKYLELIRES